MRHRAVPMHDAEIKSVAADFWKLAGSPANFPRDLEASVLWALPLAVVKIPRLRVRVVRDWLAQAGFTQIIPAVERDLRACVVASRGRGVVFVDGADPADEQRMSLAHELAHFLLDYLLPRERTIQVLGHSIIPVLDGDRAAAPAERLSAVLRGVHVGVYTRLWKRGPLGLAEDAEVVAREDAADALALELLAPRREVLTRARLGDGDLSADSVIQMLRVEFGLPMSAARAYADVVCVSARPSKSIRAWLGLKET